MTYISQVLKRNRTLRVLNLSDNRIDAAGLTTLAEALVSHLMGGVPLRTDVYIHARNTI